MQKLRYKMATAAMEGRKCCGARDHGPTIIMKLITRRSYNKGYILSGLAWLIFLARFGYALYWYD